MGVCGMDVHGDPGAHALARNYFEELKNAPLGYQMCMDLLTTSWTSYDDHCKLFCLTVIRNYILEHYDVTSAAEVHAKVRSFIVNYVRVQLSIFNLTRLEDEGVRKMAAEVYSLVCFSDYPMRWKHFVRFMANSVHAGSKAAQHYLDVMTLVSDSIAEPRRFLPDMTAPQIESIVHYIEESDVDTILGSFCVILEEYGHALVNKCLETIASLVQWLDVSHVMNHVLHKKIAVEINIPETRDLAAMCLTRIISHLKTEHKWRHSFLDIVYSDLFVLHKDKLCIDYDVSFAVRISQLLNAIGLKLLECYRDASMDLQLIKAHALKSSISSKFSQVVTFIKDPNLQVSTGVVPFAKGYMKLLSEEQTINPMEMDHVQTLLRAVLIRIKMDIEYRLCEDEGKVHEEDEFFKNRKMMREIIEQIFFVDRKVVFDETRRIIWISLVKKSWEKVPFNEAEYPIFLLGLVGSLFLDCEEPPLEYEEISSMFLSLVDCGVVHHPHIVVAIQYFTTVTARENLGFFRSRPSLIQTTFSSLLHQGLFHRHYFVRSRCAGALADFFKHFRAELKPHCAEVVAVFKHFLDVERASNLKSYAVFRLISGPAQLRLAEAGALAVTSSNLAVAEQSSVIKELVQSATRLVINSFAAWSSSSQLPLSLDKAAVGICHGLSVVTMISKAFEDPKELAKLDCAEAFLSVLRMLQRCAVPPMYRADVHEAMLNFTRRMLACLDEKFVPFFSHIVTGHLLHCHEAKSVIETSDLLIDIVYQLKHKVLYPLSLDFGTLICYVYDHLTLAAEEALTEEKRIDILENRQISVLSIILSLRDNDLLQVVVNDLHIFYLVKVIYMLCLEAAEGQIRKYRCNGFNLLMHFIKSWDTTGSKLHGESVTLIFNFVIRTSFRALREAHEDQYILDEVEYDNTFFQCAGLLRAMYEKRGKEMAQWLATDYLPLYNVSVTNMVELVHSFKVGPEICTDRLKEFFAQTQLIRIKGVPSFAEMLV